MDGSHVQVVEFVSDTEEKVLLPEGNAGRNSVQASSSERGNYEKSRLEDDADRRVDVTGEKAEDDEVYEVESILKERTRMGMKEYFVRWKGYGPEYDTWEPEDNLNCDDIIKKFKKLHEHPRRSQRVKRKGNEEEDDEDFEPSPPSTSKRKARVGRPKSTDHHQENERKGVRKGQKSNKEVPLVIKCKTIFAKKLILKVIRFENRRLPDDDESPDPGVKYYMRYDIESGQFFVGDVRVDVDEAKKCIVCCGCEKVFGDLTPEQKLIPGKTPLNLCQMVREMKLHIIGRHLGGYTCWLCDEPYRFHTQGSTHFYKHMAKFHKEELYGDRNKRRRESRKKRKEDGTSSDEASSEEENSEDN